MGHFRSAYITEGRIYDNPADPENSNYDVPLLITVLDAVLDPQTGQTLRQILQGMGGNISLSDALDSTSDENDGVAATPLAIKRTYDKATEAYQKATSSQIMTDDVTGEKYRLGVSNGLLYITDEIPDEVDHNEK